MSELSRYKVEILDGNDDTSNCCHTFIVLCCSSLLFLFSFFFLILCICFHTCSLHNGTEKATRYLCTTLTNKVDFLALQILHWTEWPLHSPAVLRTSCCTNSFGAWAPKNPSVKNIVFVQNCVALAPSTLLLWRQLRFTELLVVHLRYTHALQ